MLLFLFLPPILSLFIYMTQIKKRGYANTRDLYFLCFFVSMLGIYWFPWGDTQSHFSVYYSDIVRTYYELSIASSHWLYDTVILCIAELIGNFQYGFLFWIFVPFIVFIYAISNHKSDEYYLWPVVLYLLLAVGIRELLDLCRTTSAALFLASGVLFWDKKKFLTLFCLLLSFMLHDTARIIIILLPLCFFMGRLSNKMMLYAGVTIALLSIPILNNWGDYFLSERNVEMYLSAGGLASKGVGSGLMRLLTYVNVIIFIINVFVINRNRDGIDRTLFNVHILFALLVFAVFFHWVGRERMMIYYNMYAIAIILIYFDSIVQTKLFNSFNFLGALNSLFVTRILIICMLTFAGRYIFNTACRDNGRELSIVSRTLYVPSVVLLDIKDFGFSDNEYNVLYDRVIETNE